MADRRRRRRRASQDSEDDDESASGSESGRSASPGAKTRVRVPEPGETPAVRVAPKSDVESECESEDGVGEAVLSDYESADPEENGSRSEGGEEEEEGEHFSQEDAAPPTAEPKAAAEAPTEVLVEEEEEEEEEGEEEEEEEREMKEVKADEKGNLAGERQSGDGQESTDDPENKSASKPGQKLDDDEDRKNPAYIPRKGLFFEHDVRGQTQDEERPKGRHRKLWKDEGRWEHDKFREEEQAPKSREELIAIYGYDIRNGNGSSDTRPFKPRKPRHPGPLNQESKRYRDVEKPPRSSWHGAAPGARSAPPVTGTPQSGFPAAPRPQNRPSTQPPARTFQSSRRPEIIRSHPKASTRPQAPESERAPRLRGRGSHGPPHHARRSPQEDEEEEGEIPIVPTTYYKSEQETSSSSQQKEECGTTAEQQSSAPGTVREVSPPPERPVEKKSYSLARRSRARPSDLSKQASLEEAVLTPQVVPTAAKTESWQGQGDAGTQSGLSRLDQDLARLNLAGQSWTQSPASYLRPEMRGIPSSIHMGGGPPQYGNMEDMGVGGGRAKRYSSQRQRPVPEPAPMHLGLMEGHYYETMSFQGPIYTHGDSPAAMPPQGLLVQPEMHLPHPTHPGLHPHQSGGPIPNPALYAAPPVSLSPGQPPPQQLLPPPFYPPPGVMTFSNTNYPYPAGATLPPMYPNAQAQSQVYGGVTYFDTVQQQAQPKPSPPRRTSQPVTVKPPPPEDQSRKPSEEVRS
ncbi:protein CASC3 [Ictalurus furcatus]|uniref:protein CASC3 n=1 Tax=Ictalurus furcatus TaxID=66913 RepID=UPI00235105C5|nr:protein CASC3 [Ictalurus furcatus]